MKKPPPRRKVVRAASTSSVEEVSPIPSSKGKAKAPEKIGLPGPSVFLLEEVELYHWEETQNNVVEFVLQGIVEANIAKRGQGFDYYLCVSNEEQGVILQHAFDSSMNPKYAPKMPSFTWNYYREGDPSHGSWALKFHTDEDFSRFRAMFQRCVWETLNQISFDKVKEDDQRYVLSSNDEDVIMAEVEDEEDEEEVLSELDPDGMYIIVPFERLLLTTLTRRK